MMEILECYKTLGLPPDASREDAKHAYRKLVNRWHPDRFARDDALHTLAEEHLKLFNVAYAELKKHIDTRPRKYRPPHSAPPRGGATTGVSPGFRPRRSPGSRSVSGSGAVLNRLTRKFRQMLSSWVYTPQRPVRIKKRPGKPSGSGPPNTGAKAQSGPRAKHSQDFDEIFNEVAGPDAARLKKTAARKKHGRLNRPPHREAAFGSIKSVSRKTRGGNSPVVTPVSRVRRVGKIRRI